MKVSSHSGRWTNGLGQDWGKVRRAASCQSRKKCCLCLKFSSLWNFCTNFDFLKNPLKYYISSLLRFSVSLNFAPMANASLTSPWSWPVTPWLRDGLWPQTEVSFNPSLPLTRSMTRAKLRDLSKPNILAWKVEIKLLIGYFYLFLLLFFIPTLGIECVFYTYRTPRLAGGYHTGCSNTDILLRRSGEARATEIRMWKKWGIFLTFLLVGQLWQEQDLQVQSNFCYLFE